MCNFCNCRTFKFSTMELQDYAPFVVVEFLNENSVYIVANTWLKVIDEV